MTYSLTIVLVLLLTHAPVLATPDLVERVVFFEPQVGIQAQADVLLDVDVRVQRSIDRFRAHLVRVPEEQLEALWRLPGVTRVVENATFSIPEPASTFTAQSSAGLKFSTVSFGQLDPGGSVTAAVRMTNRGTTVLDLGVSVTPDDVPEGTELVTSEPGVDEYRIEWRDPGTGEWLAVGEEPEELSRALLIGEQIATDIRLTAGRPLTAGNYVLTHTLYGTVIDDEVTPETVADVPWHVAHIRADEVWSASTGSGVTVAVLDTGINPDHPELAVAGGYNAIEDDDSWQDDHGHGTAVAGVLGANGSFTDARFNGGAPGALLYSVKVMGSDGKGTLADILAGIAWAADNGTQVLNMSFGTSNEVAGDALGDALANVEGAVFIAAAGNSPDQVLYPAACENVIAAGATDANYGLWASSARGPEMATKGLLAPGVTLFRLELNSPSVGYGTGTSFAAPGVTAAVALLLADGVDPDDVYTLLAATAVDLGYDTEEQGAGLVDVKAALDSR